MNAEKWPKKLPQLTEEQQRIRNEWMVKWHEILPNRFGIIERFNHGYPKRVAIKSLEKMKTLEIGAGLGEHLNFEDLNSQDYFAIELRGEMATVIKKRFPKSHVRIGDCQQGLPFENENFNRVLAIHVLEHLPNLPSALKEVHRVLRPAGQFSIVIPCEGGGLYTLARKISAERLFKKRYKQDYEWFWRSEHVNTASEIIEELKIYFDLIHRSYFPFILPFENINLCIGIDLRKKKNEAS